MKCIKDVNFKGKRVLVRVDFNVKLDDRKNITDDFRIRETLPTIKKLIGDGARVVIMSHSGRPKKGGFEEEFSLIYVAKHLSNLLGKDVVFTQELLGDNVTNLVNGLKDGDVMLLENIRFYPEETKGDEAFAQRLAKLGDCYVNDAFGAAHRSHVSTAVIAKYFPNDKYFGFLMEHEVINLQRLMQNPQKPFTSVIGGAKISSKISVLQSLLNISDNLLIGGGMVFAFLKAQGKQIGKSLCEDDCLQVATDLMTKAKEKGVKIYLPIDVVVADKFANDANRKVVDIDNMPPDWLGMDIGEKTAAMYNEVILNSKTILWNGPMGVFEMSNFMQGTKSVAEATAEATDKGAFSTIGGGDSVAAINLFNLSKRVSYISTGGGAMLEYLENGTLPGIEAILN
ncbi:MAG: phosphoglycerate kinase [Bacteroidales bacterium]|jgi:phosphoglycerate kinase|nr:phosphoglycerate kinase [Bacteroidales bacterium]